MIQFNAKISRQAQGGLDKAPVVLKGGICFKCIYR